MATKQNFLPVMADGPIASSVEHAICRGARSPGGLPSWVTPTPRSSERAASSIC